MRASERLKHFVYVAMAGACAVSSFACAHGVEADFDPRGEGITGSAGGLTSGNTTSTVTGGNGGAAGNTTATGGGAGSTGEGGSCVTGAGGTSGGATGSTGSGGATGTGGATTGAGGLGPMPDAGQSGAAGTSGGIAGSSGAAGAAGHDAGSSGGASGGKLDAGMETGPICPADVALAGSDATPGHGTRYLSDVLYTDNCTQNQVVIGYTGYVDTRTPVSIGTIQTICADLSVTSSGTCQITASPGTMLPMRGTVGTVAFNQTCPANQVVVGFQGRALEVLYQVGFQCAPLVISRVGANYNVSVGPTTPTTRAGGTDGTAFVEPCAAGEVARGTNVTIYQGFVGAFGLICGTPSLR